MRHDSKEDRARARDTATLEAWYAERGSRVVTADFGQPLPPLPIPGHANCVVPNCHGYTGAGAYCADHFPMVVG